MVDIQNYSTEQPKTFSLRGHRSNVGKIMPSAPSASHHHFYKWYVTVCLPFPNGWFIVVLSTYLHLVGGFNPYEKYESKLGS